MTQKIAYFILFLSSICTAQNIITAVDTGGDVGDHTSISVPSDGLPVVSYWDRTDTVLKVVKCGNASCTSGNIITALDMLGLDGYATSIAVPLDGLPLISYQGVNLNLKVVKCGNTSCSSSNTITTVDTAENVGHTSSIAIPSDGLPVVSYYHNTNFDLMVVKCGDASCSSGNTITAVDTVGMVGLLTSIAISSDGLPVVSYYDASNGDLKVLKCGNASCTSGNIITAVDTAESGLHNSIAIPSDGLPVVSYQDIINRELKVLKCGNAFCSSDNSITTVDAGMDVGEYTSIAVPSDGLPIVSYYDRSNFSLKMLKCGNTSCSSGNTITTVDTGYVGTFTSVAVPSDGLPIVSYYGNINGDLKVLKCSRPDCSETASIVKKNLKPGRWIYASMSGNTLALSLGSSGWVQISDVLGNKKFETVVPDSRRIKIPDLEQGIHFVRLTSPEGSFVHKVSILY